MLDSLKDMYISYPFMPVASAPEWYSHVKDIRYVLVMEASDFISQYKNNGNRIQAWLKIASGSLSIKVLCMGLEKEDVLPVFDWTAGAPGAMSYMLVDSAFATLPKADGLYQLHNDVLIILQEAPHIINKGVELSELHFDRGYNVGVSDMNDGIMLFGGAGAGKGSPSVTTTTVYPDNPLPESKRGYGARSINGFFNNVWIDATYPTTITMGADLQLVVGTDKSTEQSDNEED